MKKKNAKIAKSLRARFVILNLSLRRFGRSDPDLASGSKDGVSLIIAIIFVSAFMLVMAGLFEARLRVIQAVGNREQEAKARYLAESAAELASYAAATHGAGWNLAEGGDETLEGYIWGAARALGISSCGAAVPGAATAMTPCSRIQVIGRAADTVTLSGGSYYSVPMKATGNAGICDAAHSDGDADSACNWNKLYVGESVEVPLFYELDVDVDGDGVLDSSLHNFGENEKEFKLRVRAPCDDFTDDDYDGNCAVGDRVTLYPPEGPAAVSPGYRRVEDAEGIPHDPVLIQWSVSDVENTGVSTLVARDNTIEEPAGSGIKKRRVNPPNEQNTEISSGRINLAKDGLLLPNDPLKDFSVLEYIAGSIFWREKHQGLNLEKLPREIGPYISNLSLEKPVLRLSLVGQPQKDDENPALPQNVNNPALDIPYLEYQVLAKDIQISDSKSTIVGWAEIGGFRKEIRRLKQRAGTLGGFALESF